MRVFLAALLLAAGFVTAMTSARAADTSSRNYIVFFKEWSAAIDKPAASVISAAAKAAKANPAMKVHVIGYADTTGSGQANHYLTQLRAQVVTDALTADGLPADRIEQAAEGAVPAIGTKQESRRVTIALTPSS